MQQFRFAITQKLNNLYLKKKLLIFYFLCAILPISILGVFLFTDTRERLMTLSDSQIQSDNQANRNILMSVTSLTSSISKIIASDETLSALITTEFQTTEDGLAAYRNFTLLDEFSNNHAEITDLRLYIYNPSLTPSGRFYAITPELKATAWFQTFLENPAEITWIYNDSFSGSANLYLLRKITLPYSDNYAVLAIGVSNNYLSSMNHNKLQATYLSLENDCVFYSTNEENIGRPLQLTSPTELRGYNTSQYRLNGKTVFGMESTLKIFSSSQTFHIITISNDSQQFVRTLLVITAIILIAVLIPLLLFVAFSTPVKCT